MARQPRDRGPIYDELVQMALDYPWEEFESEAEDERIQRITGACRDVATAYMFVSSPDLQPYYKELRSTFANDCDWDQAVSPAMLRTDFERAIKSRYIDYKTGMVDSEARDVLRIYGNDHVLTVLIRFLVAQDVDRYRSHVQLNHARCDPILCEKFPDEFLWLRRERNEYFREKELAKIRREAKKAKKASDDASK